MTLEEYEKSGMGWYIWELMITGQWGNVHGVFYADGTVRDPSIVAALLRFFRNRGTDAMPEVPDREGRFTAAVFANKNWLASTNADWQSGLDLAERSANLLEAAQLIAMHDPPTRQVAPATQRPAEYANPAFPHPEIHRYPGAYQVPEGDPRPARPPGWIR